jgi:hypothetical protein
MMFDGAKPSVMGKNILIRSLQSFVVIPILATNFATFPLVSTKLPTVVVSMTEETRPLDEESTDNQQAELVIKAKQIDNYFHDNGMKPLEGYGMKMVLAAKANDIDPFLLPAIAVRESTGGVHACKSVPNNAWGWNSCKRGFNSYDEAITTIAKHLGGNMATTAKHYENKTTIQILESYNPRSIVPRYPEQVMNIMKNIETHTTQEA